ncbi:MAG TPA: tetratricopeptide repeat protein [Oculatellaceae cyanobacterium]|jgi:tetratricopeptide (TPR) repeat protein
MSDSTSLRDRYLQLIDEIVQITLKGQIRSKEQVYQMLVKDISVGTGEIFERCIDERLTSTQDEVDNNLHPATATRRLRALKTIEGEWQRWQKDNRIGSAIAQAVQQIITAEQGNRLTTVLRIIDPNQQQVLTLEQLQQLAKALQQQVATNPDNDLQQVAEIATGLTRGINSWQRLQGDLVSWIYEGNRGSLGFGGTPEQSGPWALWAKQVNSLLPQSVFHTLASNQSLVEFAANQTSVELSAWVELTVVLQCLQRGLVEWFDKLVYDSQVGSKLSISIFLTFSVIWSQLASGFNYGGRFTPYADACFQLTMQILRAFSQRSYFPLYGGIFASFAGNYLRDALNYLDEPLRRVAGTTEKARILTLVGYSFRTQGRYDQAIAFHQEALEIARTAGDQICEIASFNHLSRISVGQKNYAEAINYSQRALILARQSGDKLGEANALANLGYSEVFQAQQLEQIEPEVYETAINYLEQGLNLSERLGDSQSKALCLSSLGIANVILEQPQDAIAYLESSLQAAQFSGDLYLQGLSLAYLAEALYNLKNIDKAVLAGCLGMYLLEQIAAKEWRQPAGLITVLQGQMGIEAFPKLLQQQRPQIIAVIGVDGYDYIPQLLQQYQSSIM